MNGAAAHKAQVGDLLIIALMPVTAKLKLKTMRQHCAMLMQIMY
ncbi:Aspartate 1-decarboxylase (EC [uncultured Gammaproteobacteria bacterium]|nr:Aspartate 1-decarboxylase (EC [uncultured Gammaproteobacteria bacterium]